MTTPSATSIDRGRDPIRHAARHLAGLALTLGVLCASPLTAQDPPPDPEKQRSERLDALKNSMKERYADLEQLRDDGKVGETSAGEVEVVKAAYAKEKIDPRNPKSETVGEVVSAENGNRKELYRLLAEGLEVGPAEVGRQNALRTLRKADADHWFKLESGRWEQRKNIKQEKKEGKEKKKETEGGGT